MTSSNDANTGGQSNQPFKRPAPREKGQPAGPTGPSGPLPMGPPPGGMPQGAPQGIPAQPGVTPVQPGVTPGQPVPGAQPGAIPGQFPAAQVPAVTPVPAPVEPASAPSGKDAREKRGSAATRVLPLAVAAAVCLLLASIGLLAFLMSSGDDDGTGARTAYVQRDRRTVAPPPAIENRRNRTRPERQRAEDAGDAESASESLPALIDFDAGFEQPEGGDMDASEGPSQWFRDAMSDGGARVDSGKVFGDRMPDADDLELDGADMAEESAETPEEGTEEEAEEETGEESVERPEPFTEMPDRVSLPRLPSSADQAAPVPIGVVHKLESDDVTFLLGGASEALGSKGKFGIKKEDEPSAARVLASISGQVLPVARLAAENEQLTFQWLADDAMSEAEYLSNCNLVVTVADQSKAVPLREPEVIAPLKIDVLKTGASFKERIKAVPSSSSLNLEIIELSDAFPNPTFVGGPRLQPQTKKVVKLKDTSEQELLSLHVTFSARRGGEVSLVVKPIWTDGQVFQLQKALARVPALQRQKQVIEAQFQSFRGAARTAAKPRYDREMEAVDLKIAHFIELEDACQQIRNNGLMHFRVFLDVGGREINLLTTKPDARAGAEATGLFSEAAEAAEEKPPSAKEAPEG